MLALLCGLHAWLALSATREKTTAVDEMAHLTAGRALWQGDYRLQPENGVLPQLWQALPAHLNGPPLPPRDHAGWTRPNVWTLGHAYFHESGHDLARLLFSGRAMNVFWSLGCGLLIFGGARRLFGSAGSWLAILFWTFCPTFLAHGALATSDLCLTFFLFLSVGAYWRHLERPDAATLAASAFSLGLAMVAKYSAVLLAPMCLLMLLVRATHRAPWTWHGRRLERGGVALLMLASTAAHLLLTVGLIWAFHRFRFAPVDDPALVADYTRPWAEMLRSVGGSLADVLSWARHHRLLPDAYLYGFGFVIDFSRERGAFLNGETSLTGWAHFFPYAFLVKTPLPLLLAGGAALGVAFTRWRSGRHLWRSDLYRVAPWVILFLVYWAASVTSSLNIGHRHLLPIYPVMFLATGALGWAAARVSPRWWGAGLALVACHVGASVSVRPHYLAFFNTLAGGPEEGYRHLVDSSLDWGQDLPGLAAWLQTHATGAPRPPVYLAYFGTGDPAYHGIRATAMVPLLRNVPDQPWHALEPGLYCISATLLQQAYSPIRGPWTEALEREFQQLRGTEPALLHYAAHPEKRAELEASIPARHWSAMWKRYEALRFKRLCQLLRARRPEAQIGYAIHVYRVSQDEIAAVNGPLSGWLAAIEQAGRSR